jgi:hypothetical protein
MPRAWRAMPLRLHPLLSEGEGRRLRRGEVPNPPVSGGPCERSEQGGGQFQKNGQSSSRKGEQENQCCRKVIDTVRSHTGNKRLARFRHPSKDTA